MSLNDLAQSINPECQYSINDLHELCAKVGYDFSRHKLRHAVNNGKLKSHQIGGKHTDHYISGEDAIAFFLG